MCCIDKSVFEKKSSNSVRPEERIEFIDAP
jgi:hypothetical protein